MENNCYFVNSRGILKSCDFHSPNPRSSWTYDQDYLVEMIHSPNMFDTMSIYVCTDVLPFFCNNILPHIHNTFYLVSGDSDATVPNGGIDIYHDFKLLQEELCLKILNHPKLIKWFAQDCIFTSENLTNSSNTKVFCGLAEIKICQLPIGLDYHTISNDPNKFWKDSNEGNSTKYQEYIMKNIREKMQPYTNRIFKIFIHMLPGAHRQEAIEQMPRELVELSSGNITRTQLWEKMTNYTFVLSPHGSGPDCHRHWESLCLGCIPIMKTFGSDNMFEDLPVVIVKEWSDVNKELLEKTIETFKNKKFNYNKLLLSYWVDQFSSPPVL